jgi:hypothetical protein
MFQHNALRAICPATVNIVMGVISHSKANRDVRCTAIQCFVIMVQVLNKSSPEQVGIRVSSEASDTGWGGGHWKLSTFCLQLYFPLACSHICHLVKIHATSEGYHCQHTCEQNG